MFRIVAELIPINRVQQRPTPIVAEPLLFDSCLGSDHERVMHITLVALHSGYYKPPTLSTNASIARGIGSLKVGQIAWV